MATINEIAKAAGVSKVTVSNILNGRNKENRPTALRRANEIRALAEQLGYRPNAAARAVSQGRHGNLALIFPEAVHTGSQFQGTLRALIQSARLADQRLMVTGLPDAVLTDEARLAGELRRLSADGLLINYIAHIPAQMPELLDEFRIPVVWLNHRRESDCLFPDDFAAARRATERLIGLGHRRIVYVHQMPSLHYSTADRQAGYKAAMAAAGLEPLLWIGPRYWLHERMPVLSAGWLEMSRDWLKTSAPERPTAALVYSDYHAYPFYTAALSLGIRVPEDLSIVTFDEEPSEGVGVSLTTSLIPSEEIGRLAVETLLRKIADPLLALPPQAVPHGWHEGVTVAPPGEGKG